MKAALFGCVGLIAAVGVAHTVSADGKKPKALKKVYLADDFAGKALSKRHWKPVRVHDTKTDTIAVEKGNLVVSLNTLKTDDRTVKLRGIRSTRVFEVPAEDPPLRIGVTIDWNDQSNGSYLTAGFALQPVTKAGPKKPKKGKKAPPWVPHKAKEALAFEIVGVPPAKNARPFLWRRTSGGLRPLYTEGWPQPKRKDRVGRRIRRPKMVLAITERSLQLYENGKRLHSGPSGFSGRFRLMVFVTGHSNYPTRTIKFDDVRVERPVIR